MKEIEHPDESALAAFEKKTAVPMLLLSALLVPTLVLPLLLPPLPKTISDGLEIFEWFSWAMFLVEYVVRLTLSRRKAHFVRHNLIDLAIILLPLLRPLRLASSARSLRLLRAGRIVAVGLRGGKQSEKIVNHRSVTITAAVIISIVIGCASLIYDIEHTAAGANIVSIGDAFWWAMATVTSVGYGDRYPVTTEGRLIASFLMLVGICLTGLIAAGFASVFIEQKNEEEFDPQLGALREHLDRIDLVLERLENAPHTKSPSP